MEPRWAALVALGKPSQEALVVALARIRQVEHRAVVAASASSSFMGR
jgi:hypothetical protein